MPEILIPATALSPKQKEVLQLLANGLRTQAIADQMGISLNTVDAHIAAAKGKKGTETLGGLVAAAMRAGEVT